MKGFGQNSKSFWGFLNFYVFIANCVQFWGFLIKFRITFLEIQGLQTEFCRISFNFLFSALSSFLKQQNHRRIASFSPAGSKKYKKNPKLTWHKNVFPVFPSKRRDEKQFVISLKKFYYFIFKFDFPPTNFSNFSIILSRGKKFFFRTYKTCDVRNNCI